MHDAAGQEREGAGDQQGPGEHADHGVAVLFHGVPPGVQDRERQRRERENRQQMDRAPRSPQSNLVDEERAEAPRQHQADPGPADRAVRNGALGGRELNEAQHERAHGGEGMELDDGGGIEERRERHGRYSGTRRRPAWDLGSRQRQGRDALQNGISSSMSSRLLPAAAIAGLRSRGADEPKSLPEPPSSALEPPPTPRPSSIVRFELKPCSTTSVL